MNDDERIVLSLLRRLIDEGYAHWGELSTSRKTLRLTIDSNLYHITPEEVEAFDRWYTLRSHR